MRIASRRISPWVLCIIAWPLALAAQIEDDEFRSGLIGQYSDHDGHSFTRRDATVSIAAGPAGTDRRLAGDSIRVLWTGLLMSQAVGEYRDLPASLAAKLHRSLQKSPDATHAPGNSRVWWRSAARTCGHDVLILATNRLPWHGPHDA